MPEVHASVEVLQVKEKGSSRRSHKPFVEDNTLEPTLALKLFCEFIGTSGLAYTVVMNALNTSDIPVPVCAALYLMLMVYGIGSVSGCHINPGVSAAVFIWGAVSKTNPKWMFELPLYIIFQTCGAVAGAALAVEFSMASNISDADPEYYAIGIYPYRDVDEKWWIAMSSEGLALSFFCFAILRVCCDHDKPPQPTDGLVIGISLLTAIVGTASISAGAVNPAVATAIRIVNYVLDEEYDYADTDHNEAIFFAVYWAGPLIGALLATSFHFLIEFNTSIEFTGYSFLHNGREKCIQEKRQPKSQPPVINVDITKQRKRKAATRR